MSRSPSKRLSSSAKKQALDNSGGEDDLDYDDDRGAGGLARDFRKAMNSHVGKRLGVKSVQVMEIKSFLKVSEGAPASMEMMTRRLHLGSSGFAF